MPRRWHGEYVRCRLAARNAAALAAQWGRQSEWQATTNITSSSSSSSSSSFYRSVSCRWCQPDQKSERADTSDDSSGCYCFGLAVMQRIEKSPGVHPNVIVDIWDNKRAEWRNCCLLPCTPNPRLLVSVCSIVEEEKEVVEIKQQQQQQRKNIDAKSTFWKKRQECRMIVSSFSNCALSFLSLPLPKSQLEKGTATTWARNSSTVSFLSTAVIKIWTVRWTETHHQQPHQKSLLLAKWPVSRFLGAGI